VEPRTTLEPATDQTRPVLERLAQLYMHDLSEFRGYPLREDGTFRYDRLAASFTEPGRRAYLIRHGEQIGGFTLTRPLPDGATSIYGFFVVRALRRRGVGRQAALELLTRRPGAWGIAYQENNPGVGRFWRQVATAAVGTSWREEARPVRPPAPPELPPDIWLLLDTTR
jgi:predicted acetyltransferase